MQVEDLQARMLRQLQRHKKTLNIRQHKKSLLFKPIQEQESPIVITQLLKKKKQQTLSQEVVQVVLERVDLEVEDRKSTRLNSSHVRISYAVFCLKKKRLIAYST